MPLAFNQRRSYWSILAVGAQDYDHQSRVATKVLRQENLLLGYGSELFTVSNRPAT